MKVLLLFIVLAAVQAAELEEPQFTGPDADLLNANCTACHSADMVLFQPRMSADAWAASVAKMRNVYKASIEDADAARLPAALAAAQAR